jgi:hypothetical protein
MCAIGFIADMGVEVVFGRGLIALYDLRLVADEQDVEILRS